MWPPTITPCECTHAGWCERHHCHKTSTQHLLCRIKPKEFEAWDRGEVLCFDAEKNEGATSGPGVLRRAWNFGKAVVRHVADGAEQVDESTLQARLDACRVCPSCDLERMVCREPECGCLLQIKATWRSESCPRCKWPAIENENEVSPTDE